ncbi:MAG TPA: hypothetical protein VHS96_03850, partial [Bacteroidia bacterium]|nr:hypothetical protein [Bacteroidia bacterium]
ACRVAYFRQDNAYCLRVAARIAQCAEMVAEAEPQVKPKRKMPVSTGRPKGYEWFATPLPVRMRVRSLYLVQGLEPSQISPKITKEFKGVKLEPAQISALCARNGWTKEKRLLKAKLEKDSLTRTQEQVEEVVASTAMLAEEGSLAGIQRALECTTKKGKFASKDFAAWAAGSRQLVAIARQARGLDAKDAGESGSTVNVMFIGSGNLTRSAERIARNVTPTAQGESALPATPAIDVAASVTPQA